MEEGRNEDGLAGEREAKRERDKLNEEQEQEQT